MDALKFDSKGLLTAVVQDIDTGKVLMVAMMDATALRMTLQTKQAHFWSRSREKLWLKGETSGNLLDVIQVKIDCDSDSLLLQVKPRGPACHTGNFTCFYRDLDEDDVKQII
jgi:phosphoribosyl-AMP cyclohydrolase